VFQANIDTDFRSEFRQGFGLAFNAEAYVPAASAAAERHGLDLAAELSMPLDLEFSDSLNVELAVITDLAAITIGRERVGESKRSRDLKRGKPGLSPHLILRKNALNALSRRRRTSWQALKLARQPAPGSTHVFQVGSLIVVVERHAAALVGKAPLLKRGVVEMPSLIELVVQRLRLVTRGVEPELVGFAHLLGPRLLVGNVAFHGGFGYMPDTADVVRTAPKCWHAAAKMTEFPAQSAGREPLELVGDMRWGQRRIGLNEEVNVVGHDFKRPNLGVQLARLFTQERGEPVGNCAGQDWQAVFGTPHQVIPERKDRPLGLPVALIDHAGNDTQSLSETQTDNNGAAPVGIELTTTASYPPAA
jgi:hypothetical protein